MFGSLWHNQPTNQPTNQPASQPASQPTNQPASQPTNQPTNQQANQPLSFFIAHFRVPFGAKKTEKPAAEAPTVDLGSLGRMGGFMSTSTDFSNGQINKSLFKSQQRFIKYITPTELGSLIPHVYTIKPSKMKKILLKSIGGLI